MEKQQVIRHFDSIDDALALFDEALVGGELRNCCHLDDVDHLWTSDGTLIPSITSPFASSYLYRGQVARYSPCLPSVFRGLMPADHPLKLLPRDRARLLIDRVRVEEFALALDAHPASAYANEIGLRVWPYAMAQHYELATDRIDLTQDHWVAAFFATHALEDGRWRPARDGVGVLYRLHTTSFSRHFKEQLEGIGKQVWPRPGEQRAYTLVLPLGLDFEVLPIEIYTFDHDESCSARIADRFGGGASLFPPDVMADVAADIRSAPTLARSVLERVLGVDSTLDASAGPLPEVQAFLEQHSTVQICDREPIGLSSSQMDAASTAVETMRSNFLNRVGALAVRHI